jgi:anaerobic ribonucleoside-triphosphate reductase activating protein
MTKINFDKYLYPVLSVGYGKRLNIVLRGCSIALSGNACYKCFSKDLWSKEGGEQKDTKDLVQEVVTIIIDNDLDGVTITGGEPTDQANALAEVIKGVKSELKTKKYKTPVDFLLFTWYYEDQFKEKFSDLFLEVDCFVFGPYEYDKSIEKPLVATSNQQLVVNSLLAKGRYEDLSDMPRIDFAINSLDNQLLFIGIPYKDEMDSIEKELKGRISISESSWN